MARPRTIPDAEIFAAIRRLLRQGDKAVSFSAVAQATGLAAPSLVQRYGSRDGMVRAALLDGWNLLDAATALAEIEAPLTQKGAQGLLKALGSVAEPADLALLAADFRDAVLRDRAVLWRARVEAALALRLGGGSAGGDRAAMLFALWQGQQLWQIAGGKGFRLKDAVKQLSD